MNSDAILSEVAAAVEKHLGLPVDPSFRDGTALIYTRTLREFTDDMLASSLKMDGAAMEEFFSGRRPEGMGIGPYWMLRAKRGAIVAMQKYLHRKQPGSAMFDETSGRIYYVNYDGTAGWDFWKKSGVAHELTHKTHHDNVPYLFQRHSDLAFAIRHGFAGAAGKEEYNVCAACIEGLAVFIQEKVAPDLGIEEGTRKYKEEMLAKYHSRIMRLLLRAAGKLEYANGIFQGYQFLVALERAIGDSALPVFFAMPPRTAAELNDVSAYLTRVQ